MAYFLNAPVRENSRPFLSTSETDGAVQGHPSPFINHERVAIPDLIDRLLELSRLQAGTLAMNLDACQISDIFGMSLEQLQRVAPHHQLCIDIGADVLPVLVDPNRVRQILIALVENAAQHSPECTTIWISVHRQNGMVQVNVADQGVGIAARDHARIFEAYRHQMTARAGLGLAISKGLVEAQGGNIWIADRSRKGFSTTVSFTLPIVTASNWRCTMIKSAGSGFVSPSLVDEPYRMPV